MKYTKKDVLEKIHKNFNRPWLLQQISWCWRHKLVVAQGIVILYVAFLVLRLLNPVPAVINLKDSGYKQVRSLRKSKFKKIFNGKTYPVPDAQIDQIIELKGGSGTVITLRHSDNVIVSEDVSATVTNYKKKWGFCMQPKLLGAVNEEGGDTGLALKFFFAGDFGLNGVVMSEGAGGGISFKPFKRLKNTSIDLGLIQRFDGKGQMPYGGIGVEF